MKEDVGVEKYTMEARKWRRVNADPEAWSTSGGYGLGRLGREWTLFFVTRSGMREIGKVNFPEESPPFCWARGIVDKIQEKRTSVGWSEKRVKGRPGDEDTSVSAALIKKISGVGQDG